MRKAYCTLMILLSLCLQMQAENWMRRLPDDAYVAVLSIPGTHDSATGNGFSYSVSEPLGMYGNKYALTQDYSVQEQWDMGIRAFDLRPAVYSDYLNINHGVMPTKLHFDTALYQLRDLLRANPSEFVIIHLLHASDGDKSSGYEERLLELLNRDDLKDYLADFRADLTVKDMRGKMLILSRDTYASTPIGGFLKNWSGSEEWYWETRGQITGATTAGTATLYMQDYSDTHNEGGIDTKVTALLKLLEFSTSHKTSSASDIVWVFNLASAYSKMEKINIAFIVNETVSTSDGYRDNAYYTATAILDYLADVSHTAGPTGIIMMDYAGSDWSNGYNTRGMEMINAIIANNFRYLKDASAINETNVTVKKPGDLTGFIANAAFNANNLSSGWQGDGFGAVGGVENAEHYNRTYNTWQTITDIPNGVYAVGVKSFYRAGDLKEAFRHYRVLDKASRSAELYAVSAADTMKLAIVSPFSANNSRKRNAGREEKISGGGKIYYIPDDLIATEYYMHTVKSYYNNTVFVNVENNTLTMGVKKDRFIGTDWTAFDDFTLTYYGNKAEAYTNWITQMKKQAPSYTGITATQAYLQAYNNALSQAIATSKDEAIATMSDINTALDELSVNTGLWADYKILGDSAKSLINSTAIYEAAKGDLKKYYEDIYATHLGELLLTNEELREEISRLSALIEQTGTSVMPGTDVTNRYLPNADFTQGETNWTKAADTRPGLAYRENISEAYDTYFHLYQDVTVQQAGIYELQVKGFFRMGRDQEAWNSYKIGGQGSDLHIYIGDASKRMKCIFDESIVSGTQPNGTWMTEENPGYVYPNDMWTASYAFGQGLYVNTVSFQADHAGDLIRIGIEGDMTGENWACFDDFRLIYRGAGTTAVEQTQLRPSVQSAYFTLDGKPVRTPQRHGLYLIRDREGKTHKVIR